MTTTNRNRDHSPSHFGAGVTFGSGGPDSGNVTRRGRIGYLPQEPQPGGPGETLLAAFARGRAGEAAQHTERLLSLGLFDRDRLTAPVDGLSTGQQQRLALARLISEPSDVLLLDEPANHLSPALVEELEAALADYDGTLVIVSHDRRLCRRWEGAHLAMQWGCRKYGCEWYNNPLPLHCK